MTTRAELLGLLALGAVGCAAQKPAQTPATTPAAASSDAIPRHDAAQARHLLNRFAFGPTPGQAESVAKAGLDAWLEQQLAPAPGPDPALGRALEPYRGGLEPPLGLLERFGDGESMDPEAPQRNLRRQLKGMDFRSVLGSLALAELTRHVESSRQVEEVMVNFWTNHFNVFAKKGLVRLFAGDYVERAIRPHALGNFHDLLLATARHPAMLLYLDNARSIVNGKRKKRGLNENYARELLELHTLGVDGGYTQKDVTEVARVLTGWSVKRPREGAPDFVFRERVHDRGEKIVLGRKFPAGHGEDEGLELLEMLAQSPATARHLAKKLCARLVADDPPADCVDAATHAYLASHGDVKSVLRSIFQSPSFWDPKYRNNKLKAPIELVASALRAFGAKPDGTLGLARVLAMLGEPLLLEQVPTGYSDAASEWLGGSSMLGRMNFATALASGRLPGTEIDLDRLVPESQPSGELARSIGKLLFGPDAPQQTLDTVEHELAGVDEAKARRTLAVALLLGSPAFQRQ